MADINNEQRKALARIVEENGTYEDYYKVKHADKDAATLKKFAPVIAEHTKLVAANEAASTKRQEAVDALEAKHRDAARELSKRQLEEMSKLHGANSKVAEAEKAKVKAVAEKLEAADLHQSQGDYDYNTRSYKGGGWKMDTGRFRSDYNTWRKSIVAEIWASDTAKLAQKLVKKFLSGIGKDEPTVQEATV